MNSISASQKQEAMEWQPEAFVCPHTLDLKQVESYKINTKNCSQCDLTENLWLCLTCGKLNCGRNQLGGAPGNSHGIAHYNSEPTHPVAVKLGSITPDGTADIYCYACDDEVKDAHLAQHLANFGINIAEAEKTEKSLMELQLEQNVKWDFSLHSDSGEELEPVFGPGLTGIKNLGNSCYMSSVLQCLFSLPEFTKKYYHPNSLQNIISAPENDLGTQVAKIADGLLSGRYSVPDLSTTEDKPHQRGISPAMFKKLIGEGHPEFSTMKQQDAFEFLTYFFSKIQAYSKANGEEDPTACFNFKSEQRLECNSCHKVRYNTSLQESLTLHVPARRVPVPINKASEGEKKEKEEEKFEKIDVAELFDNLTKPESVEYLCKSCKTKNGSAIKNVAFKTFPDVLLLNAQRFEIINWVPTKLDIPLEVPGDQISLDKYKVAAPKDDEDIVIEEDEEEEEENGNKFEFNSEALESLIQMGIAKQRAEKALYHNNNDLGQAVDWIFAHMDDPDIDAPLDLPKKNKGNGGGITISQEQIEQLTNMGFLPNAVRKALRLTNNNNEAAVEWLFSNPDDPGESEADQIALSASSQEGNSSNSPEVYCGDDQLPAKYKLQAIVCHKGKSVHAGHYVAFVKREVPKLAGEEDKSQSKEQWVLFNDEKVVSSGEVEEMKKYAYIYIFVRAK